MTLLKDNPILSKDIFYAVVVSFYFLDTYFLYQEESFIELYNKVRKIPTTDFSLKIKKVSPHALQDAIFSFRNAFFYLVIGLIVYFVHF